MSDQALIPSPPQHHLAQRERSSPIKVTGKVRQAIEAMVWLALPRAEAAKHAGMTEHGLYKALRKAPVKAAYLAECEVLRTSDKARRLHRLIDLSTQDTHKVAAVNATLALEREPDQVLGSGRMVTSPGLTIIVQGNATLPTNVDAPAKPLINNDRDMTIDHDPPPDPALPQRTRGDTGG